MVAQEPLELYVQVRILAPQVSLGAAKIRTSTNDFKGTLTQRIMSDSHEMGPKL